MKINKVHISENPSRDLKNMGFKGKNFKTKEI